MIPWVHVASLADAYGAPGWLIVPTRSAPLLTQGLQRLISRDHLRWLPHFEGWWVSSEATPLLFASLDYSLFARDLCTACASDGGPCEAAIAAVCERIQQTLDAQAMFDAMRLREAMKDQYRAPAGWTTIPREPPRSAPRLPLPRMPSREDSLMRAAAVLGVSWPSSQTAVQKAFRRAIARAHPDLGGSSEAASAVIAARKTLINAM